MITYNRHETENSWYGLLNRSDATVLTPAEERKLLVELVDCKKRILEGLSRTDGDDALAAESAYGSDFQHLVRELAEPDVTSNDALGQTLRPLARRYQEIRAKLAMANVRLVAHIAKRYHDRGIPPGDLIQDGFCALLVAIDRFDLVNETRLATYAIWWIRQAIQHAIAGGAYPVRLNPRQLHQLARARAMTAAGDFKSDPTTSSGLPATAFSPTIEQVFAATRPVLSLDAPSRRDDTATIGEFLVLDDSDDSPSDPAHPSVGELIKTLGPREQVILKLRFGLGGEPPRTLIQVSKVLGVSKERVRQIQDRALKRLRSSLASDANRTRRQSAPAPGSFASTMV